MKIKEARKMKLKMSEKIKLNVEYNGIICIGADYETHVFDMLVCGKVFHYVDYETPYETSETDYIKEVIMSFMYDAYERYRFLKVATWNGEM